MMPFLVYWGERFGAEFVRSEKEVAVTKTKFYNIRAVDAVRFSNVNVVDMRMLVLLHSRDLFD